MDHHYTGQSLVQCCPRGSSNIVQKKFFSMLSKNSWDNIAQPLKTSYNAVQETPGNIAHKKSCSMLSKYSWDNIAQQVKTFYNVVQEALDNT